MDTMTADLETQLRGKYDDLRPVLDPRAWRLVLGADSLVHDPHLIARAANVPLQTILDGATEVKNAS